MQPDGSTFDEVDRMVIGIAAHEDEEIPDPVRYPEAEHFLVERDGGIHVLHHEGDMAELERPDAGYLLVLAEVAPVLEELDGGALAIRKRQDLAEPGDLIVGQL